MFTSLPTPTSNFSFNHNHNDDENDTIVSSNCASGKTDNPKAKTEPPSEDNSDQEEPLFINNAAQLFIYDTSNQYEAMSLFTKDNNDDNGTW